MVKTLIKQISRLKVIDELQKIRREFDENQKKGKQMLANLIHDLTERKGRCFRTVEING